MSKRPYRISLQFVIAAPRMEDAEAVFDRLIGYADEQGLIHETSFIEEMDAQDVIPESPLDDDLKGLRP